MVEQRNSDGGTVWWNGGTVWVEQCRGTGMEELGGGTVEQCKCNSVVEQCDSEGGTIEQ